MSFDIFLDHNFVHKNVYRDKAVTFSWLVSRLDEYLNSPPNKAYFLCRKETLVGTTLRQMIEGACRTAIPSLPTPIPGNCQVLAAGSGTARVQAGNALLALLSQCCSPLLAAGKTTYDNRYLTVRQTHMPTSRFDFIGVMHPVVASDIVTTVHLRSFLDLLEYRIQAYHTDWGHGFNTRNQIYISAGRTLGKIATARNVLPPDSQAVAFDDWAWSGNWTNEIENECTYWRKEIPEFKNRRLRWLQMQAAAEDAPGVTVKRRVTQAEANTVQTDHGLRQGPNSMEKHKFFGGPGSAPGQGVLHPFELTIVLKRGVYEWLHNNSTEGSPVGVPVDYNFASFSKAAEPHCYGIHEDALGIFNTLIHRISIAPAPNQQIQYASTPAFDPGFVETYPPLANYHFPA